MPIYTLPQVTQTCGRVKLPRPRGWGRMGAFQQKSCYPNGEQLLRLLVWHSKYGIIYHRTPHIQGESSA